MYCKISQKFNNLFHLELEALKIGYNSLVNFEPFNKNTQENEEPNTEKEDQIKREQQEQEVDAFFHGYTFMCWRYVQLLSQS